MQPKVLNRIVKQKEKKTESEKYYKIHITVH